MLVRNSGRLLEKDELMKSLWPDTFIEEPNLAHNVYVLRKALGESPDERYIQTVPKRGYRFVASVRDWREWPHYALAYAELANCYWWLSTVYLPPGNAGMSRTRLCAVGNERRSARDNRRVKQAFNAMLCLASQHSSDLYWAWREGSSVPVAGEGL